MNSINWKETGGQFDKTRILPTMTVHNHENGTFFVTDDLNNNRLISSGHASIQDAVKLNIGRANRRIEMK